MASVVAWADRGFEPLSPVKPNTMKLVLVVTPLST